MALCPPFPGFPPSADLDPHHSPTDRELPPLDSHPLPASLCPQAQPEDAPLPATSARQLARGPAPHSLVASPLPMASLARRHPKTALLAAATTAVVCLPFWLPLLLITSPFLLFTSLFSMGVMALLKFLFLLSLRVQRSLTDANRRRRLGMQYAGMQGFEDVHRRDEGCLRENRIHEYLEDQLKNLSVVAFGRTESAEDLPCSFSFGGIDGHIDAFNYGRLSHDEA
ncbi:hypothetical protein GOP47_0023265 [Adiantum capillus-veneris]|uniref:Uncharacterized protein n=1 Tax=Adiantum capillus-veneris TaxID=13818 RepID=A0A9D4Z7P5_ADICA|nr:hypothetical protein GOP47_0023265 [Adiantum capillus-veneris]